MGRSKKSDESESPRRRKQSSAVADWGSADSGLLRAVIAAVTLRGGAIRFGYSRDGGAYSIGIYGDGKPFTEFKSGDIEVDEWLGDIREDYQ